MCRHGHLFCGYSTHNDLHTGQCAVWICLLYSGIIFHGLKFLFLQLGQVCKICTLWNVLPLINWTRLFLSEIVKFQLENLRLWMKLHNFLPGIFCYNMVSTVSVQEVTPEANKWYVTWGVHNDVIPAIHPPPLRVMKSTPSQPLQAKYDTSGHSLVYMYSWLQ